jgi:hypothetical protein
VLTLEVRSAQREAVSTAWRATKGQNKHAKPACLTVKHVPTVESGRQHSGRAYRHFYDSHTLVWIDGVPTLSQGSATRAAFPSFDRVGLTVFTSCYSYSVLDMGGGET